MGRMLGLGKKDLRFKKYRVYDTRDNDKLIGEFTVKEICEKWKCCEATVRSNASKGNCLHHRYYIIEKGKDEWAKRK